MSTLFKSIKDFFTPSMLKLTILPFVLTLSILSFFFYLSADLGIDMLSNQSLHIESSKSYIENGVQVNEEVKESYSGSGIVEYLLNNEWTSGVMTFFIYSIGLFFVLIFSIILAIIIIGFLTPAIIRVVHRRHYSEIALNSYGNILTSSLFLAKTLFITLILFFTMIPLYFIPVVGWIIINIPFYYFFHKMINYDVSSSMMGKKSFNLIKLENANTLRLKSLFLYLISLVPGLILITTSWYIIYMAHSYFKLMKEL